MAVSLQGQAQSPSVPAARPPSVGRPLLVTFTLNGVVNPGPPDLLEKIVWGTTNGTVPATYGDLGGTGGFREIGQLTPLSIRLSDAGATVNYQATLSVVDITAMTPGDTLWIGYCALDGNPVTGTALAGLFSGGILVA